jgi:hypothetical protein
VYEWWMVFKTYPHYRGLDPRRKHTPQVVVFGEVVKHQAPALDCTGRVINIAAAVAGEGKEDRTRVPFNKVVSLSCPPLSTIVS